MTEISANIIQKYNKRSIPWLLKKATEVFNAWIRKRDDQGGWFTCISCGENKTIKNYARGGNYHAGHYYPGTDSALKYNEINVNGQCGKCNTHLHGNQTGYRIGLIKKYGIEEVEKLEQLHSIYKRNGYKWDRFFIISVIIKYR